MDPSTCYLRNGYTSSAYYYGGSFAGIEIGSGWPGSSPSSSAVPFGVDLNTPLSSSPKLTSEPQIRIGLGGPDRPSSDFFPGRVSLIS
ncbi:hypothetical protein ACFX1X_043761 [Malus domestica]